MPYRARYHPSPPQNVSYALQRRPDPPPSRRPGEPKLEFDSRPLTGEELQVLRDVIRQHRYYKYEVDDTIRLKLDPSFAILIGHLLKQVSTEDRAVAKLADELINLDSPPEDQFGHEYPT